jgi:hypothetical protein
MRAARVADVSDAVEYGWRRRAVVWSIPVAMTCAVVAVELLAAGDGLVVWRLLAAVALAVVAWDSIRFVVLRVRHAAIGFDRRGITLFGIWDVPWTAIRSCRVERGVLVLEVADDAQGMECARWMSPRMRRYWTSLQRDRHFELDASVLAASPSQLAAAIERFAPKNRTTAPGG